MVIAAAVSVYSVTTVRDWKTELGKQVASLSEAIVAGELGVGVGALVAGPIGAIVGGIAGSILGADALANWPRSSMAMLPELPPKNQFARASTPRPPKMLPAVPHYCTNRASNKRADSNSKLSCNDCFRP
jgi:hypothetical protein